MGYALQIGKEDISCEWKCQRACIFKRTCSYTSWEDRDDNVGTKTDTGDHEPFP